MVSNYIPRRGDVVWLQFDPQAGHEQRGVRPALVLSPVEYNRKTGLMIACPITSKSKGYPFEVVLPGKLVVAGVVLADQLKNLDWAARKAEFKCTVPAEVLEEVLGKAATLIQ